MYGNKDIWEKEWVSVNMETVPSHASDTPSDEIILFKDYMIALGIKPPKTIIDIGSGKGRNSLYLAKEGFEVYGMEYIESAVRYARRKAKHQNVESLAHFLHSDVSKPWKFNNNLFDIAIDSLTTVGLLEKERIFCRNEMHRKLKKGGLALIRVVSSDDKLEKELMNANPGPEPNSSIWPKTGKFQRNFSESELREFYKMFDILTLEKLYKKATKIGRQFTATNWWIQLVDGFKENMIKKILFATTNKQKAKILSLLTPVKLLSLADLPYSILEPEEIGNDALDISITKARHYWNFLKEKMPVLSQDDTLELEVDEKDNPGNHIKDPVVKKYGEFTDKNAIQYYTELAQKYGGTIPMYFKYGHTLCFEDKGEIMLKARTSKLVGRIVTKAKENESTNGYFLSAIMQVKIDNGWKYYSELTQDELVRVDSGIAGSLKELLS